MNAGTALREARRRAKLTQRELAQRADVAQSVVARIESGLVDPRVSTLDRLLRYCGDALYSRRQVGAGVDRTVIRDLRRVEPLARLQVAEEKAHYLAGVSKERFGDGPLFDAIELLVAHRVRFVVIGGVAAILHGLHRFTYDVDICYAPDRTNLKALGRALRTMKAYPRGWPEGLPWSPDPETLDRQLVHTLQTSTGPLDLLAAPFGVEGYPELELNSVPMKVGTIQVRVASVSDLIRMKQAVGRPQDIADAERLGALLDEENEEPE